MTPESANALAELRDEAARADASLKAERPAAADADVVAPPVPPLQQVADWRAALDLIADELAALYPGLKPIYTDEARARLAASIAAVAVKYNFTALSFLDRYKEEIGLLLVLRPIVRDTLRVIEAAKKAPPAAVVEAEPPAPDAGAAGDALKPNSGS